MKKRLGLWFLAGTVLTATALTLDRRASGDGTASPEPAYARPESPSFATPVDVTSFLRGNIHVHTWMSDGDSSPGQVVRWYEQHGYDFVAITDHNRRVDASKYAEGLRADFVLVPGEEVTMVGKGKPVHVNALCHTETIGEAKFATRPEALRWAIDRIHAQGGVALVNHPNFMYALDAEHIAAAEGADLLDIYNGHPMTNNEGSAEHSSTETIWQTLLDRGQLITPAAVDDAHAFTTKPPEGVPGARPGTGWIGVAATERSAEGICKAIAAGHVYASNGPRITRIQVAQTTFSVWLADADAVVDFIGTFGEVLTSVEPIRDGDVWLARYTLSGDEAFVRARVEMEHGDAWTPAFAVKR